MLLVSRGPASSLLQISYSPVRTVITPHYTMSGQGLVSLDGTWDGASRQALTRHTRAQGCGLYEMETRLRLSRLQEMALEQEGSPESGAPEWFPAPSQLWWDDDVAFEPNYTPGQLAGRPMSLVDASKCHRKLSWAVPNLNMLNQGIRYGKRAGDIQHGQKLVTNRAGP